ncbi:MULTISPECIES: hypothetical protein [unclassified Duganella]|jgi:hypothetical protein|uniref:hypothetical protein n=1 Tax=unclassified Duganella TaxID=2636909 RepID=UPI000887C67E|nr:MULTISPECIES: hypothetical protein [unclassified Duganella]SDG52506.1 hypothetical protein SAMN05216320_10583 [Duganella sp. OV458]SDJ75303.1 hypothetical protein SAMN05428973_10684 [Duganella sp. OV510]
MQIATMLSLAGSVTCVGVFIGRKNWILALAFFCSIAYTVLAQVVNVPEIPGIVVQALPFLFLALVVYEVLQKLVMK